MRVQTDPPLHLTYCLNVHPGESWGENLSAIETHALRVRNLVAPPGPFGLGLRLGHAAAGELSENLDAFKTFLADNGLYAFTVNAFPYGQFHATRVKEDVYRPDWRCPERRDYTLTVAADLAAILPEGVCGTISTVPGSYKEWIRTDDDLRAMATHLADTAEQLSRIAADRGREICLALEPEPDCYLETTDEAIAFFTGPLRQMGIEHLQHRHGRSNADAEAVLARHVGVCFDTAHMAVEFEDLPASLKRLKAAGVRVAKVHLSSALRVGPGADAPHALEQFNEDVYLHQVKVRDRAGRVHSYADLPQALTGAAASDDEWRVHFHVPLFFEGAGELQSTSGLLKDLGPLLRGGVTEQIEIETYTFGVLPPALAVQDVADGIAREYRWVLENLLHL